MSKHTTAKATPQGRAETIRRKKARKNKYATTEITTSTGRGERVR